MSNKPTLFTEAKGPRVKIDPELLPDVRALLGKWILDIQLARASADPTPADDPYGQQAGYLAYLDNAQSHLANLLFQLTHAIDVVRLAMGRELIDQSTPRTLRRKNQRRVFVAKRRRDVPAINAPDRSAGVDPGSDRVRSIEGGAGGEIRQPEEPGGDRGASAADHPPVEPTGHQDGAGLDRSGGQQRPRRKSP